MPVHYPQRDKCNVPDMTYTFDITCWLYSGFQSSPIADVITERLKLHFILDRVVELTGEQESSVVQWLESFYMASLHLVDTV